MSIIGIIAIALAVLVAAIVLSMLLTRRLREKYAVLWLVLAVVLLVLGLAPSLLTSLASLFGVRVPANMLFAAAIVTLLGICVHLSWELSQAEDEGRRAAEEIAILSARVDRLEAVVAAVERPSTARAEPGPEAATGSDQPDVRAD